MKLRFFNLQLNEEKLKLNLFFSLKGIPGKVGRKEDSFVITHQ